MIREFFARPATWTPFEVATNPKHPLSHVDDSKLVLLNERYQVSVSFDVGETFDIIHLSIKDGDKSTRHDWRDLQRIKNEIVGVDATGLEVYPPESRLVDMANQYHLWCFPPGMDFGFGFLARMTDQDGEEAILEATLAAGGTEDDHEAIKRKASQRDHLPWHRSEDVPEIPWAGWEDERAFLIRER